MDTTTPTTDGPPADTADDGSPPARRRDPSDGVQHARPLATLPPDGRPRRTRPTTARFDRKNRHRSQQAPRTTGQSRSDASRRGTRPARPVTTQTT